MSIKDAPRCGPVVWMQASTGFLLLDSELLPCEASPAVADGFADLLRQWMEGGLQALGDEALALAARQARDEGRTTHLRDWRPPGRAERFDLAVGPIGDLPGRAVLLEFWPLPAFALGAGADELKVLLHELRNPLAGLRGAAQLLARMTLAPEARELAELVIGEADRMAELLQSRTRPARAMRAHNPHELLERLCVLLSAEAPGVRVERDYDPSLPPGLLDGEALFAALLNLGRNAIAAGARMIVLRSRAEAGRVLAGRRHRLVLRIDVEDDGEGIPPELGERIFEPMVSGRPGGSGLGLAVVRETVRAHGGEIGFRSKPGSTCFSLLLPWEAKPDG